MKPRPHNHHSRRRPPPVMSSLPSPPPAQPPSSSVTSAALPPPSGEMRLDCNLASLCEHIQAEGFGSGEFSDVAVQAMGSTYRLHRLILSRSAYFRNMLHGPWKEAGAPTVVLQIDDPNVNSEAIAMSLAYLYGQSPKLNDNNAFRVLAAASFLDIQDLCSICTDFIIAELWTTNFLQYQVFAESQDYGIHGERVRSACWGYLCQSATMELRNLLPKLSSQTLHALITSDELWVPNEEKRFELALYTLLAKGAISDEDESSSDSIQKGKIVINSSSSGQLLEFELINMHINNDNLGSKSTQSSIINLADCMAEFQSGVSFSNLVSNDSKTAIEGPSTSSTNNSYNFNEPLPNNNNNNNMPSSWGNNNRTVGRRKVKNAPAREGSFPLPSDEYESFMNMFEGGSLLYCNMSFESLLHARKQLEELGFPCKALNDGLWLQMLLCHRVQAVVADTCRNCCLMSNSCACRQTYGYSHGGNYYRQDQSTSPGSSNNNNINNVTNNNNVRSVYISDAQGDGTVHFGPTRVHRGASDGLAGIGRGSPTSTAWGPTRYVFSRIPVGSETSHSVSSHTADVSGDGLTVLVGLSEGGFGGPAGMSGARVEMVDVSGEESEWGEMEEGGCGWGEISLDFKTPLSHFPPFRFGVEFEDVHRLTDGQVKHSVEVFYAGSLWKVSVQAFNDEDPQGRRTLGLFLHRRKAEVTDPLRKAHIYIDSREKVTARYQLICPSKREVMVFGSLKQAGTLLPKAPKGWGWRTALLFDELADLLQAGSLRVAAIVQLV